MTLTYFVTWRSCSTMTMRSNRTLSADSYLDSMPSEFYLTGIKELFDKCNICTAVKGAHVDILSTIKKFCSRHLCVISNCNNVLITPRSASLTLPCPLRRTQQAASRKMTEEDLLVIFHLHTNRQNWSHIIRQLKAHAVSGGSRNYCWWGYRHPSLSFSLVPLPFLSLCIRSFSTFPYLLERLTSAA